MISIEHFNKKKKNTIRHSYLYLCLFFVVFFWPINHTQIDCRKAEHNDTINLLFMQTFSRNQKKKLLLLFSFYNGYQTALRYHGYCQYIIIYRFFVHVPNSHWTDFGLSIVMGVVFFSFFFPAHLCFIVYLHPTVPHTKSSIIIRPCSIYLSHDRLNRCFRPLWALMESYSHCSEPGLCLIASVSVYDALLLEWDESQHILPGHYWRKHKEPYLFL